MKQSYLSDDQHSEHTHKLGSKLIMIRLVVVLLSVLVIACIIQFSNILDNQSISKDTIILKTEQIKGPGLMYYTSSIHNLSFSHPDSLPYNLKAIVPEGINNISVAYEIVDYKAFYFHKRLTSGEPVLLNYKVLHDNHTIDTLNVIVPQENSVLFLKGLQNGKEVLVVDQNNNKDFRDDTILNIDDVDIFSLENLIRCEYKIFNGNKYTKRYSWITIGTWMQDGIWYSTNQHFGADLNLGKSKYNLELFINDNRFSFTEPHIALTGLNGAIRDTILAGEMIGIDDYLVLKEGVYRFADLSNDGRYITLVKEDNYDNISGTQIGLIAQSFECHTLEGNTFSSEDFKGNYYLIVNVSACWSEPSSYQCYKDLAASYGSKLEIIVIDKDEGLFKRNIDYLDLKGRFVVANNNNDEIAQIYRPVYCSRTCILVGPDGRITDKFEIFDWEQTLLNYVEAFNN